MEIGLALGSNQGQRLANLIGARKLLLTSSVLHIADQSPVYETAAVDVPPEFSLQSFLNAVLIIESKMSVRRLWSLCRQVEHQIGRIPNAGWHAPRPIDIDIIYADALEVNSGELVIPHPRWATRRFVVQPLADLRPGLIIPGQAAIVSEVLADLSDHNAVTLFQKEW